MTFQNIYIFNKERLRGLLMNQYILYTTYFLKRLIHKRAKGKVMTQHI